MSVSKPENGAPEAPARESPVAPGDVIGGRYLVGTLIGEGGMGLVCEATHVALGVPVAIKLIRPAFKHDAEFVQRFLNEARRAALLKGEHVARVHDVGQLESGEPYLVMERLEGIPLETYLHQAGPLLPPDAVALVLQVCDGLAEAHAQGVVHRDVKPGNLFLVHLPNGRVCVKILDFGISKQIQDEAPSTLTNRERSLGSPWYMSPEQMIDSSTVDHRSDVWSLGVVLYELLTNERPFDGSTIPEVCAKVLTGATPPLRSLHGEIDPALQAVVFRCLAKEPKDRFPDVLALADALQAFSGARRDTAGYRTWEPAGELLPRTRSGGDLGSMAPLATTRKLDVPPRERRARWIGIGGVAACLLLAAGAFAKTYFDHGGSLVDLGFPGVKLAPGPEPVPLDRGNGSAELALGAAPSVTPLATAIDPEDAGAPDASEPPAVELPSAASEAFALPPASEPRSGRPASPYDDNPYEPRREPSRFRVYSSDLREALGRAGDEYRRGLESREEEPAPSDGGTESDEPPPSGDPGSKQDDVNRDARPATDPKSAPAGDGAGHRYGI